MKGLVTRVECSKDDHELSIMNGLLKRLINGRFIHVSGYSIDVLSGTIDCSTAADLQWSSAYLLTPAHALAGQVFSTFHC